MSLCPQPPSCHFLFFSFLTRHFFFSSFVCSRRAATSQVSRPNSSRAAGAGGSSNTMLKLYTDDSPGLRVYVSSSRSRCRRLSSFTEPTIATLSSTVTLSSSSSFHSPSSHLYSSSISPPKSSALFPSNSAEGVTWQTCHTARLADGNSVAMRSRLQGRFSVESRTRRLPSFNCNYFFGRAWRILLALFSEINLKLTPTGWLCGETFSRTSGI